MGAWGTGIFDDDSAYDWDDEIGTNSLAFFRESFDNAIASPHVGFDACHAATVSAAYIDAILNGTPYRNDDQEAFDAFVANNKGMRVADLLPLAAQALRHVLDASDVNDLWAGAALADYAGWQAVIRDLRARLVAASSSRGL